jgi:hypothetical protein
MGPRGSDRWRFEISIDVQKHSLWRSSRLATILHNPQRNSHSKSISLFGEKTEQSTGIFNNAATVTNNGAFGVSLQRLFNQWNK